MSFSTRPSPAVINHKYRALVRDGMIADGEIFQFVDYALFDENGTLVDIFHHIKSHSSSAPDGYAECTAYEDGLSGLTSKSGIMFQLLDDGYENDPFGVADYLAACARVYPHERAEWNAAWMDIMNRLSVSL